MKNPIISLIGNINGNEKLIKKYEKKYIIYYNFLGTNVLIKRILKSRRLRLKAGML